MKYISSCVSVNSSFMVKKGVGPIISGRYLHKVLQRLLSHSCKGTVIDHTVIFLGSIFFVLWLKNRETVRLVRPESFWFALCEMSVKQLKPAVMLNC